MQGKIAAIRKRRATLKAHRKTLEESGREQLSLTDPGSRVMKTAKGVVVGYNVQIAVDPKHNLIAEQQVHIKVTDVGLLAQTAVAARENLAVEKIDAVADKGYYKIGDIEACEAGDVRLRTETPRCPVAVTSTWSIAPSSVRAWLDEHEGVHSDVVFTRSDLSPTHLTATVIAAIHRGSIGDSGMPARSRRRPRCKAQSGCPTTSGSAVTTKECIRGLRTVGQRNVVRASRS